MQMSIGTMADHVQADARMTLIATLQSVPQRYNRIHSLPLLAVMLGPA
jgi:hypothetical protein